MNAAMQCQQLAKSTTLRPTRLSLCEAVRRYGHEPPAHQSHIGNHPSSGRGDDIDDVCLPLSKLPEAQYGHSAHFWCAISKGGKTSNAPSHCLVYGKYCLGEALRSK